MALKKVKRKLDKILQIVKDYEFKKLKTEKAIMDSTERIKELTEDIKNTQIT